MSHPKSKKVWWCNTCHHTIMASYCNNDCPNRDLFLDDGYDYECSEGNLFNDCKLVSENNQEDIKNAWK